MKKIPQSLRQQKIWYLREHLAAPVRGRHLPSYSRYSPITLAPLRPDNLEDYSDFVTAFNALNQHPHWFEGLGIRVKTPLLVIVFQYVVEPSGIVSRPIRDLFKRMGAYIERAASSRQVIQAVVSTTTSVPGDTGWYDCCPVHVCINGMCELTGEHIPGCAGDPFTTDQAELARFFNKIQWKR